MKGKKKHFGEDRCGGGRQAGFFTHGEVRLLRSQIRNNAFTMDSLVRTIDLLVNKECCPPDANTLLGLRERLEVAIAENDTFRKALWRHLKAVEQGSIAEPEHLDPVFFLVSRIRSRNYALMNARNMK